MPMYEYRCDECGKGFELLRRMSEADFGVACPKCESSAVKRQYSTFAAVGGDGAAAGADFGCAKPGCGVRSGFG
jgi:putative FmdB family regulatory protein